MFAKTPFVLIELFKLCLYIHVFYLLYSITYKVLNAHKCIHPTMTKIVHHVYMIFTFFLVEVEVKTFRSKSEAWQRFNILLQEYKEKLLHTDSSFRCFIIMFDLILASSLFCLGYPVFHPNVDRHTKNYDIILICSV